MFLVLLTYTQPLHAIDSLLDSHRDFLTRHYAAGVFLLSGRKEPRDGGVILANASTEKELRAILAEDPFQRHGVADYQVVQFIPTMAAPGLESLVAV